MVVLIDDRPEVLGDALNADGIVMAWRDLVVPGYVSQPVSPVLVPVKRLVGFTRVHLGAGQSRTVTVTVPRQALAVTPGDVNGAGPRTVLHGTYVFSTGTVKDAVTASSSNSVRL